VEAVDEVEPQGDDEGEEDEGVVDRELDDGLHLEVLQHDALDDVGDVLGGVDGLFHAL